MSGYVGLTIREENGNEIRTAVDDCTLNKFINNSSLFTKDPNHVQRYLGLESVDRGKVSGHNFLAPPESGLVVVDYVNNQILADES